MAENLSKLEQLPSRVSNRESRENWSKNRGDDFPYRHMKGWLKANMGKNWNGLVSQWTRAMWVPARYRRASELDRFVETRTELRDGLVVAFKARFWFLENPVIVNNMSDVFYVHPMTGLLCYQPRKTSVSWKKQQQDELHARCRILGDYHQLAKENGIWYELKGHDTNCRREGIKPNQELLWAVKSQFIAFSSLVTLKKQLSHKQLKSYDLTNG